MAGRSAHALQIHRRDPQTAQQSLGAGKIIETVSSAVQETGIRTPEPVRLVRRPGVFNVFVHITIYLICFLPQAHAVIDNTGQDLIAQLIHHFLRYDLGHDRLGGLGFHRFFHLYDGDLHRYLRAVAAAVGGGINYRIQTGLGQIHLAGIDLKLNDGIHIIGDRHALAVGDGPSLFHFQISGAGNDRRLCIRRGLRRDLRRGLCRLRGLGGRHADRRYLADRRAGRQTLRRLLRAAAGDHAQQHQQTQHQAQPCFQP